MITIQRALLPIFCLVAAFPSSAWCRPDLPAKTELLRAFGIEALDQTDAHSSVVLGNFLFLLKNAFPPTFTKDLGNVKFLYAYEGHDQSYDLGAFHPGVKAISIGGKLSYPENGAAAPPDVRILATLAHELGHAFLLGKVSPAELNEAARTFGGWSLGGRAPASVMDGLYFQQTKGSRKKEGTGCGKSSVVSGLAEKNVHEWFADAFAAASLVRLGEGGHLGKDWRAALELKPRTKKEFWSNYNCVSREFSAWLGERITGLRHASAAPRRDPGLTCRASLASPPIP